MELFQESAIKLRNRFIKGEIKAEEIVSVFLSRIKKHNDSLGAFLQVFEEKALLRAKDLDKRREKGEPLGKLAGIPVAIKDNMHIQNEITTCGSKFLKNYKAPFHATAIRYMEEEDAIFIGKTNLDEFAMGSSNENSAFFAAHNPWNLSAVPGGSSGGSASAVAARLVPIATGSDTGGSIRQPASFCGIIGFKPTYGRVSRYGLVAFGSSFDQIGPFTTTVEDAALTMEVIGRPCSRDATCLDFPGEAYLENMPRDLKGITIGVPWHFLENLQEEAHRNFYKGIDALKDLGANIIEINLDILKYSIATYYILSTAEASTNLARFDGIRYGTRAEAKTLEEVYDFSRDQGFGKEVKKRILLGTYVLSSGFKDAFYKKAQKIRTKILEEYDRSFDQCDLICMPTSPFTAFTINAIHDPVEMYLQDIFTISANLAGLPAISVPSGFNESGMPFGLQFTGPQMYDMKVLHAAHAFEKKTQHTSKIPEKFRGP